MQQGSAGQILLPVLTLVLLGAFLVALDAFHGAEHRIRLDADRGEIEGLLPILRERVKPAQLAREALLGVLWNVDRITSGTAALMQRRLRQQFGTAGCFAFWDGEGRLLSSSGFPTAERDLLGLSLQRRLAPEVPTKTRGDGLATGTRATIASAAAQALEEKLVNWVDVVPLEVGGRKGFFGGGLLFAGADRESGRAKIRGMTLRHPPVPHPCTGFVALFVPERIIGLPWVLRRLKGSRFPPLPPVWAGSLDELPDSPLPVVLQSQVKRQVADRSQGILQTDETVAGFVRLPEDAEHVAVMLRVRRLPWWLRSLAGRGLLGGFGGALILGLILLPRRLPGIRLALGWKVVALLIAASALPLGGLYWLVQAASARGGTGAPGPDRERVLPTCEEQHLRFQGAFLHALRQGTRLPPWEEGPGSLPRKKAWRDLLQRYHAMFARIDQADRGRVLEYEDCLPMEKDFFDALGQTIIINRQFLKGDPTNAQERMAAVKGSLYVDSVADLVGREAVYEWFPMIDSLFFTRINNLDAWIFVKVQVGEGFLPRLSFVLIFNKRGLQQELLLNWVQTSGRRATADTTAAFSSTGTRPADLSATWTASTGATTASVVVAGLAPSGGTAEGTDPEPVAPNAPVVPLAFATQDAGRTYFFPESAGRHPLLGPMLGRIVLDGGQRNLRLEIGHQLYQVEARRLEGFEAAALVLRPVATPRGSLDAGLSTAPARIGYRLAGLYPLLILLLATWLFQRFYVGPIRQMTDGVDTMASGKYDVRLEVPSKDELGRLCQSFNGMAAGLQEKEYLSRFLSDLAMHAVREGGLATAVRTRGTVLFSDIRNFTAMSEELVPEMVAEILSNHFTMVEEVIEAHHGSIDKFIGDAVMATFLPAHGQEDPAIRATRAGLALCRRLEQRPTPVGEAGEGETGAHLRIGVGIGSGEILMGMLGREGGRRDFTVTGTTVKQAALMEKLSKRFTSSPVVVCPQTAARLGDLARLLPRRGEGPSPLAFEVLSLK